MRILLTTIPLEPVAQGKKQKQEDYIMSIQGEKSLGEFPVLPKIAINSLVNWMAENLTCFLPKKKLLIFFI